jgi:hypothetical protein
MGKVRNVYKVFVGKPEGNIPLGRPRHRWEDYIRICVREIRCEIVDWIHQAQGRDQWWPLVNKVINLQVP